MYIKKVYLSTKFKKIFIYFHNLLFNFVAFKVVITRYKYERVIFSTSTVHLSLGSSQMSFGAKTGE